MKDVAGLDAKRLIAGGRGAFGRVERVTLSLDPWMGDFEWSSARFGAVSRAVDVAAHV